MLSSRPPVPAAAACTRGAKSGARHGTDHVSPLRARSADGLAVTGLAVSGTLPVALSTSGASSEPNVRTGASPILLHGNVTVSGLKPQGAYVLYRYNSTANLPSAPPFASSAYEFKLPFAPEHSTWSWADPNPFSSAGATYYIAAPSENEPWVERVPL
eukprot:5069368-Prymnesium_polylepis.2